MPSCEWYGNTGSRRQQDQRMDNGTLVRYEYYQSRQVYGIV